MKKWISERTAIGGLMLILALMILFHLLVIFGVLPPDLVWGGRFATHADLLQFEWASVFGTLILLVIVSLRAGIGGVRLRPRFFRIAFWVMFTLFLLNTVGNLASTNSIERFVFAPLTLLLALFCLRIQLTPQNDA